MERRYIGHLHKRQGTKGPRCSNRERAHIRTWWPYDRLQDRADDPTRAVLNHPCGPGTAAALPRPYAFDGKRRGLHGNSFTRRDGWLECCVNNSITDKVLVNENNPPVFHEF
jgi:hypothetical protein